MKKEKKKGIEEMMNIWHKTDSMETFLYKLNEIEQVDPYTFSFIVFLSSKDDIASLSIPLPSSLYIKTLDKKEKSILYYISNYVGKKNEKIEGKVILFYEKPNVSCLFSVSTRDFIDRCLLRYFSHSYPKIYQPILRQDKLASILAELEKQFLTEKTIRITKSSAKRWIVSEGPDGGKKRIGSRLDWENLSVKDAFREAAEEGKWFTKLTYRIYTLKENSIQDTSYYGTIGKRGMFLTNRWLTQYSEVIIPSLLSIAEEKINLYKNRSRKVTTFHEIRPLVIKFDENIFEDKKNSKEFITVLKKIPHFGYSVIHANPYIHMSLLDYKDGSSFEILVHRPDRILILPQIRVSSISLERIIGHISEKFSEGEVEDLKSVQ